MRKLRGPSFVDRLRRQDAQQPLTPLEARFQPLCNYIERTMNYLPVVLSGLGAIFLALYSLRPHWLLPAGVVLSLVGLVLTVLRTAVHRDLEREIQRSIESRDALGQEKASLIEQNRKTVSQFHRIFEADQKATYDVLNDAANSVCDDLHVRDTTTRLSLYFHDKRTSVFTRIARVSENPALVSTGRISYPSTQGFIAQVWQEKSAIAPAMPAQYRHWLKHQIKQYGFTEAEAKNLTMHSRCMIGIRLDYQSVPVGVLIIESTTEGFLKPSTLDELRGSLVCTDTLPRLLVASKVALGMNLPES